MVPRTEPPQQYKQLSRKGKKAWRKNVDVSEVQSGLESAREEIIKGWVIHHDIYEVMGLTRTAVESLPRSHPMNSSLLMLQAQKQSKKPTIKYTSHSRPTKSLRNVLQCQQ